MFAKKLTLNGLKYIEKKKLSEGSYGYISVVIPQNINQFQNKYQIPKKFFKKNGQIEIVLKKMMTQGKERFEVAKKEVDFLKTFSNHDNPFFVRYFDSMIISKGNLKEIYILMEFRQNGTLWDLIAIHFEKKTFLKPKDLLE